MTTPIIKSIMHSCWRSYSGRATTLNNCLQQLFKQTMSFSSLVSCLLQLTILSWGKFNAKTNGGTNVQNMNIHLFIRFLTNVCMKQTSIAMVTFTYFVNYLFNLTCIELLFQWKYHYLYVYCTEILETNIQIFVCQIYRTFKCAQCSTSQNDEFIC